MSSSFYAQSYSNVRRSIRDLLKCFANRNPDGASLIYTIPSVTSPLQSLVHSSLGIHSLLKRQPLKHNVIDRDKVLVPPNWDSWGKIRVLRDGFDVEAINNGWSLDIQESNDPRDENNASNNHKIESSPPTIVGSAVEVYEETIRDPSLDALQATNKEANGHNLEVSSQDTQSFLAAQLELLDKIQQGSGMDSSRQIRGRNISLSDIDDGDDNIGDEARVNEHIGPVQFNMGGIQVDADDMLQRLKVRLILWVRMTRYLTSLTGSSNVSDTGAKLTRLHSCRWEVPKRSSSVILCRVDEKRRRQCSKQFETRSGIETL